MSTQKYVLKYSHQHYLQYKKGEKDPNVHQLTNGKIKVTYPNNGISFSHKKKSTHTMWIKLDNMLSEKSQS